MHQLYPILLSETLLPKRTEHFFNQKLYKRAQKKNHHCKTNTLFAPLSISKIVQLFYVNPIGMTKVSNVNDIGRFSATKVLNDKFMRVGKQLCRVT